MTKSNTMRGLFVLLAIVAIMFTLHINEALASDVPTSGCDNFGHNWGDNISCEGKFTLDDMGSFNTAGEWTFDPDYANLITTSNWSAWSGDLSEMIPQVNTEIVIDYGRLDNKRYPDHDPDSRIGGLSGSINGMLVPMVWKMRVDEPVDGENNWYGHLNVYPYYITHVDWNLRAECEQFCHDWGCEFDDGSTPDPDGAGPQEPCSWGWDNNGDGLPDNGVEMNVYAGVSTEIQGGEKLNLTNVSHVELNGQTATPKGMENDDYTFLNYDTGNNALKWVVSNIASDLYFNSFVGHIPLGDHVAVLHLTDGRSIDLPLTVASDRIMPTIASTTEVNRHIKKKKCKSRKDNKKGNTVTVDSITARELNGQLIIQLVVPDGAFQAPLPGTSGIRLRIFVGDGWGGTGTGVYNMVFLWIDAPVQSGTIVLPVDQWEYIKDRMRDIGKDTVEIAGMYREQFNGNPMGFHNRGYIDATTYKFE